MALTRLSSEAFPEVDKAVAPIPTPLYVVAYMVIDEAGDIGMGCTGVFQTNEAAVAKLCEDYNAEQPDEEARADYQAQLVDYGFTEMTETQEQNFIYEHLGRAMEPGSTVFVVLCRHRQRRFTGRQMLDSEVFPPVCVGVFESHEEAVQRVLELLRQTDNSVLRRWMRDSNGFDMDEFHPALTPSIDCNAVGTKYSIFQRLIVAS